MKKKWYKINQIQRKQGKVLHDEMIEDASKVIEVEGQTLSKNFNANVVFAL